jgi:dTDP-glucose 4,6-dehydratase
LGAFYRLGLAKAHGARYVLASTAEVYGDPLDHPQQEEYWGHVNRVGLRSVYDEAKRFAEAMTMAYHRVHGLDVRIARIFNTYGPRMRHSDGRAIPAFIDAALGNRPIEVYGDGTQTRSFCYVDDLVEGVFRLATHPGLAGLIVNLGNDAESALLSVAKLVLKLTGSASPVVFRPLRRDDPRRRRPDLSRARRFLGYEPRVPLDEGLRRTIAWSIENWGRPGRPSEQRVTPAPRV